MFNAIQIQQHLQMKSEQSEKKIKQIQVMKIDASNSKLDFIFIDIVHVLIM